MLTDLSDLFQMIIVIGAGGIILGAVAAGGRLLLCKLRK